MTSSIWKTVECPKGKMAPGTMIISKRKIGKDGLIKEYKCHFVARGLRHVKRLNYQNLSWSMSTKPSIRTILALIAFADWEGWQQL